MRGRGSDEADNAFREFYAARGQALSRAAFFLTGDDGAAQDLLQEALVRTLPKMRSGRIRSENAEPYIRQVMLNLVRSRWRTRGRVTEGPVEAEALVAPDLTDSAALDRDALGRALRTLGPRQRAVLFLRYYLDQTEAQTAAALGCSVGTVKSQAHDALARLRAMSPALVGDEDLLEVHE